MCTGMGDPPPYGSGVTKCDWVVDAHIWPFPTVKFSETFYAWGTFFGVQECDSPDWSHELIVENRGNGTISSGTQSAGTSGVQGMNFIGKPSGCGCSIGDHITVKYTVSCASCGNSESDTAMTYVIAG